RAANGADDEGRGADAEGGEEEVAEGVLSAAVGVGGAGFHLDDVGAEDLEFARVFDDDDAFGFVEVLGEDVDGGGFAGAGPAGDEDVAVAFDAEHQELEGHGGDGFFFQQPGGGGGAAREAADVDVGAFGGDLAEGAA